MPNISNSISDSITSSSCSFSTDSIEITPKSKAKSFRIVNLSQQLPEYVQQERWDMSLPKW